MTQSFGELSMRGLLERPLVIEGLTATKLRIVQKIIEMFGGCRHYSSEGFK
jgi:hypothetical protein